jgi:hypothetical protein
VAWVEQLNLAHAKLGNPPVYDNAAFPWPWRSSRRGRPWEKRFYAEAEAWRNR